MDSIQDRVRAIIDYLGVTQTAFSERIGTHQSVLSRALSDGQTFGDALLNKIVLAYSDINKDWILTGKGEMLKPNTTTAQGRGVAVGGSQSGSIVTGDGNVISEKDIEIQLLKKDVERLTSVLQEKERIIQILMKK